MPNETFNSLANLDSAIQTVYQNLKASWQLNNNSWKVANSFDTMLDYLRYLFDTKNPSAKTESAWVLRQVSKKWGSAQGTLCWYDDHGWWGISCGKAFDPAYQAVFANAPSIDDFRKLAVDRWKVMHSGKGDNCHLGAPNVWDNRCRCGTPEQPSGCFDDPHNRLNWAAPLFQGGVWQYDMFKKGRPTVHCDENPMNPFTTQLGPFQNTVMNGLYFVLAQQLAAYKKASPNNPLLSGLNFDAAIASEYRFLHQWFNYGDKAHSLLYELTRNTAIVRERVGVYARMADGSYPRVNGFDSEQGWAGDQGLMLGGLCLYALSQPNDNDARSYANKLAAGVSDPMGLFADQADAYIQPCTPVWLPNDMPDYISGVGVLFRYLMQVCLLPGSPVGPTVNTLAFRKFVDRCATVAANTSRLVSWEQYENDGDNKDEWMTFVWFNRLAILLCAARILPKPDPDFRLVTQRH
jgi:hypothetical protein